MKDINNIIDKVKLGMRKSYIDTLYFTDSPASQFGAEYVFTVNVAKEIAALNGYYADPFEIYIEKNVKQLAKDCLTPVKWGHPLKKHSTIFRKGTPFIQRTGRVDIAVYKEQYPNNIFGKSPFCVIELKSFNPTRNLVIKDLKRNAEFLRITGDTGNSLMKAGIFSSVHSFSKTNDSQTVETNLRSLKQKYEGWTSEVGGLSDLSIEIETFTLSKELEGRVMDDVDGCYVDSDSKHHFVGVVVVLKVKA
ncbi:hypothetical protein [Vibrio tasmaniensis]|uniref:hypothetical protein n=1 Tax=Vibrio tasmaniensis TaxID=212663 RepID=UPI00111A6437|nr:hypothetical protein [Vibrio tasmaniensis]